MSKAIYLIIFVGVLILSCSENNNSSTEPETNQIVGSWRLEYETEIEGETSYYNDGYAYEYYLENGQYFVLVFIENRNPLIIQGFYSIENNLVTWNINSEEFSANVTFSDNDNELTIYFIDSTEISQRGFIRDENAPNYQDYLP